MSTFAMFQVYQDHIKKRNVRCPEDMKWLKQYLEKKHLKAYRTNTCLSSKTEVKDWCKGEQIQFICKKTSEKWKTHFK